MDGWMDGYEPQVVALTVARPWWLMWNWKGGYDQDGRCWIEKNGQIRCIVWTSMQDYSINDEKKKLT